MHTCMSQQFEPPPPLPLSRGGGCQCFNRGRGGGCTHVCPSSLSRAAVGVRMGVRMDVRVGVRLDVSMGAVRLWT